MHLVRQIIQFPAADPGFPVGGRQPHRGQQLLTWLMFCKICMSKRKNLDPWGGTLGATPLDAPLISVVNNQ